MDDSDGTKGGGERSDSPYQRQPAVDHQPAGGPRSTTSHRNRCFSFILCFGEGQPYSQCKQLALPIITGSINHVATPERGKTTRAANWPIPHAVHPLNKFPTANRDPSNARTDPIGSTGHWVHAVRIIQGDWVPRERPNLSCFTHDLEVAGLHLITT